MTKVYDARAWTGDVEGSIRDQQKLVGGIGKFFTSAVQAIIPGLKSSTPAVKPEVPVSTEPAAPEPVV